MDTETQRFLLSINLVLLIANICFSVALVYSYLFYNKKNKVGKLNEPDIILTSDGGTKVLMPDGKVIEYPYHSLNPYDKDISTYNDKWDEITFCKGCKMVAYRHDLFESDPCFACGTGGGYLSDDRVRGVGCFDQETKQWIIKKDTKLREILYGLNEYDKTVTN